MAIIGCYSLHLYCDSGGDPFGGNCPNRPRFYTGGPYAEYIGQSEGDCKRQARKHGWSFVKSADLAYCKACTRLRKKSKITVDDHREYWHN